MFGLSGGELLTLLVVGVVLMGPNKLPQTARQAAIFIKKFRALAAGATAELRDSFGPEFQDLDLTDLNPKTLVKKQLTGVIDEHVATLSEPILDVKTPIFQVTPPQIFSSQSSTTSAEQETPAVSDNKTTPPSQIDPDLI